MKALVIEDEPLISRVCVRTLTSQGFEVDQVDNGFQAIKITSEKDYDIYLVDIRTPGMNGMEFYNHLKRTSPAMAERIIFTTGDILSTEIKSFLEGIPNLFLAKPFTPADLINVVNRNMIKLTKGGQLISHVSESGDY